MDGGGLGVVTPGPAMPTISTGDVEGPVAYMGEPADLNCGACVGVEERSGAETMVVVMVVSILLLLGPPAPLAP